MNKQDKFKVDFEDYISVIDRYNGDKEILHIEYDIDMDDMIKKIDDLVVYLNSK